MRHYDQVLRGYADVGLRSAADWLSMGREVEPGSKPRAETEQKGLVKGTVVELFTRDQTKHKASARR